MVQSFTSTTAARATLPNRSAADKSLSTLSSDTKIVQQSYQILRVAFFLAPLLAGLDKFFNILTTWEDYLAPLASQVTGLTPTSFMHIVGVVEIIVAIGVAWKPKIFGYVVAAWMAGIIINLFVLGDYFDVALRDLGLGLSAFALARLALLFDRPKVPKQV